MSSTAFMESARDMARVLESREVAQVGDLDLARARLEAKWGIPGRVFYSLRYRPTKTIAVDLYARLCAAVEASALSQIRQAEHEIATARARASSVDDGVSREAAALVAKARAMIDAAKQTNT